MSFRRSEPITASDTLYALAEIADALVATVAGVVNVHVVGDPASVFRLLPIAAGVPLEVQVDGVKNTSTTATGLFALRRGTARNVTALAISGTPVAGTTAATKDSPITTFTPVAVGGLKPYAFSLASGTLPAGLAQSATTGAISGTPTAVEAKTLVIRVTDANGDHADLTAFTITVSL